MYRAFAGPTHLGLAQFRDLVRAHPVAADHVQLFRAFDRRNNGTETCSFLSILSRSFFLAASLLSCLCPFHMLMRPPGWLSQADFLVGVAACHPRTDHSGAWKGIRQSSIFRFYSSNSRTMNMEQLLQFCADLTSADCHAVRTCCQQQMARLSATSTARHVPTSELPALLATLVLAQQSVLDRTAYDYACRLGVLPDTRRIFRFKLV